MSDELRQQAQQRVNEARQDSARFLPLLTGVMMRPLIIFVVIFMLGTSFAFVLRGYLESAFPTSRSLAQIAYVGALFLTFVIVYQVGKRVMQRSGKGKVLALFMRFTRATSALDKALTTTTPDHTLQDRLSELNQAHAAYLDALRSARTTRTDGND